MNIQSIETKAEFIGTKLVYGVIPFNTIKELCEELVEYFIEIGSVYTYALESIEFELDAINGIRVFNVGDHNGTLHSIKEYVEYPSVIDFVDMLRDADLVSNVYNPDIYDQIKDYDLIT